MEEEPEVDVSEKDFTNEEIKDMSDSKLKDLIDKVYKQQEGLEISSKTTREERVKLLKAKRCDPDPKKKMFCPDDMLCDDRNKRCIPMLKSLPPGVSYIEINDKKVIGSQQAIAELEKLLSKRSDVKVEIVSFGEERISKPQPKPFEVDIDIEDLGLGAEGEEGEEVAFEEGPAEKVEEDEKDIDEILKEVQVDEKEVKRLDKVRQNILKCLGLVPK